MSISSDNHILHRPKKTKVCFYYPGTYGLTLVRVDSYSVENETYLYSGLKPPVVHLGPSTMLAGRFQNKNASTHKLSVFNNDDSFGKNTLPCAQAW